MTEEISEMEKLVGALRDAGDVLHTYCRTAHAHVVWDGADALSRYVHEWGEAQRGLGAAGDMIEELRLAICGGEDAPGHNASLSHAEILRVLKDNYDSWMAATDRACAAESQVSVMRGALEEIAKHAIEDGIRVFARTAVAQAESL